jgi:curved DNA-binding protein
VAVKFRDYYAVLGVPRTASADDIKKAYRRLARKHHPDLASAADRARASETFKEINEAYEVLGDPGKRAKYDQLGEHWQSGQEFTPPPGSGPAPPGTGDWESFEDLEGFSDFFSSIFGRASGRQGPRGGSVRFTMPGGDVESELPVTLEELIHGGRRRLSLNGEQQIELDLPVGARDGTVLRMAGRGQPGIGGGPAGDLYLRLRMLPHHRFRVSGDDLEMDVALWPWQAVLGDEVQIETPGGPVKLKVRPGTPNGQRLRLRGRGLPRRSGEPGDLYAVIRIEVPSRPTAAEREAYEGLKRSASAPAGKPSKE